MTIGERIRELRENLGMSQDELAKKVGYKSRSSINKLELSRELPTRKVQAVARVLGVSPSYLMGYDVSSVAPEAAGQDNYTLSADALILAEKYDRLNSAGKQEASDHMEYLLSQEKYTLSVEEAEAAYIKSRSEIAQKEALSVSSTPRKKEA